MRHGVHGWEQAGGGSWARGAWYDAPPTLVGDWPNWHCDFTFAQQREVRRITHSQTSKFGFQNIGRKTRVCNKTRQHHQHQEAVCGFIPCLSSWHEGARKCHLVPLPWCTRSSVSLWLLVNIPVNRISDQMCGKPWFWNTHHTFYWISNFWIYFSMFIFPPGLRWSSLAQWIMQWLQLLKTHCCDAMLSFSFLLKLMVCCTFHMLGMGDIQLLL